MTSAELFRMGQLIAEARLTITVVIKSVPALRELAPLLRRAVLEETPPAAVAGSIEGVERDVANLLHAAEQANAIWVPL